MRSRAGSPPPHHAASGNPHLPSRLPRSLWVGLLCTALLFSPWLGGMLTGVGPAAARALVAAAGIAWVIDRRGAWFLPRLAAWLWR